MHQYRHHTTSLPVDVGGDTPAEGDGPYRAGAAMLQYPILSAGRRRNLKLALAIR